MDKDLQEQLIIQSSRLITRFDWVKFIIDLVLYVSAVLAIITVVIKRFDFLFAMIVPIVAAIYLLLKYFYIANQLKKMIRSQNDFIYKTHPNAELYVPMLILNKRKIQLKGSALYLTKDSIFLDAFKQRTFSSIPDDYITIPYGEQFNLQSIKIDDSLNVLVCEGTLIDTEYSFIVINEPVVYQHLSSLITIKE
jgi:hypothetical protein